MNARSPTVQPTGMVTVVSANYVPAARVVCRSFAEFHPGARCFVVVVDRPLSSAVRSSEPFEAIDVADVGIPHFEDLLAQYTILEANTAVKPFVLRHLFERYGLERLVYLDPDILVLGAMDAVFEALDRASVVVTPHMRDPFRDDASPREVDVLRSGTYNLGFVALRRGPASSRLLDWWTKKTEHDCVIDFENGLFVDQKWMDLVPGYFGDCEILRHPGYNVAYWNLHERELALARNGRYVVDGEPLSFFHFSGFDPDHPAVLSKHQDRHHPADNPALLRLCREYGERLRTAGHRQARHATWGYARLRNGFPVSKLIRDVVRHCRKRGIPFPSVAETNAFCRFMMTPNPEVTGYDVSPFAHGILKLRKDVAAAYPGARGDAEDPGFLHWVRNSAHEVESRELFERFGSCLTRVNPFVRIKRIHARRPDLQKEFPDAFARLDGLEPFANWLRQHGMREEDLSESDVSAFAQAGRSGFSKVLEYYFSAPSVAVEFPFGLLPWANADFRAWMLEHGMRMAGISATDLEWFHERSKSIEPAELLLLSAVRGSFLRMESPIGATVLGWSNLCNTASTATPSRGAAVPQFPENPPNRIGALLQLEILHAQSAGSRGEKDAFRSTEAARRLADDVIRPVNARLTDEHRRRLLEPLEGFVPARGVNVAGHFHYAAGAGDAAHSLARSLDAAGIPHRDVTLPVNPSRMCAEESGPGVIPERFWTMHRPDFEASITVANADAMAAARAFLGPCWDRNRKHVASWVWETDRLPGRYASAAEGLDAIWTPSEFSAHGLRATLGDVVPVHVVPYAVPVQSAPPDPETLGVGLPEGRTLFGFFFDARSVVERKNPKAVLAAFKAAFRPDDRVALVLKVSHPNAARQEMAELERLAQGLPVIWLSDLRLDEFRQQALISRLDVYVSLHRSEGFGLVLAKAMALGKPVIATGYSGNLEFMDDSSAVLVEAREIVTDQSHGPYPRGTRWSEPDHEEAVLALRALHKDVERRRSIGERARASIQARLSPHVVGERVARLLGWHRNPDDARDPRRPAPIALARAHGESLRGDTPSAAPSREPSETSSEAGLDRKLDPEPRSWPAE